MDFFSGIAEDIRFFHVPVRKMQNRSSLEPPPISAPGVWPISHIRDIYSNFFGNTAQSKITFEQGLAVLFLLPGGAHETGFGMLSCIEKAFAAQMLVALCMVAVEAGYVDENLYFVGLWALCIVTELAFEIVEASEQSTVTQMFYLELNEGMHAFGVDNIVCRHAST